MLSLLLQILVVCTSLLAWATLTINGYALFRRREDPNTRLLFVATAVLWGVTSLHAWNEGVFLFERTALVSVINSWAFTLIIPLFYLHYRFCITSRYPNRQTWTRHLLLPALLAGFYITLSLFTAMPDRLIYSWSQLSGRHHLGWFVFRISCYLSLVVQLSIYLPRLFGRSGVGGMQTPQALRLRDEMRYVVCFCLLAVIAMLTSFLLSRLFYNLVIIALGGYLISLLPSFRRLRQRVGSYLIPSDGVDTAHRSSATSLTQKPQRFADASQLPEESPLSFFTPDEEQRLMEQLATPDFLYNPDLTIGMFARHLSTNETYLSRYFNRQLGVSFPEYVTACRLDKAEVLLAQTNDSVIAISEQVGFQTLSTFYLAFNARHQMPPSQWRKRPLTCPE